MNKTHAIIFLLSLISQGFLAQTPAPSPCIHPNSPIDPEAVPYLLEINRDIWLPFSASWEQNDVEQYNALHAADFIRATGGSWQQLSDKTAYAAHNSKNFSTWKAQQQRHQIAFAFFERVANAHMASERGIYKVTRITATGEEMVFFGRFHCFHKKQENGRWQILVDYDSDDGAPVTELDFKAGKALDSF